MIQIFVMLYTVCAFRDDKCFYKCIMDTDLYTFIPQVIYSRTSIILSSINHVFSNKGSP